MSEDSVLLGCQLSSTSSINFNAVPIKFPVGLLIDTELQEPRKGPRITKTTLKTRKLES